MRCMTQLMTGLEQIRALASGELPAAPIAELMEFRPVSVEEGRVVFAGTPGPQHYNPIGTVHGGYAATLLDSAMGCAVHTTLPAGGAYTTADLQVKFLRPMTSDTGEVRCEGVVLHAGRRQAIAEGRLVRAADGKLLAHGTTTCLIL
jgi:uncharacterized protein (TIGR00369 family)